jgi:hypothetical protein
MILKRSLILSIIILLLSACSLVPAKLNTSKLIGNPDTISHIRMLDGNTGETVVFAPGEDIQAVLNFVESLNGTYDPELGISAGYLYWLAGYRDGEEVFRLTFGSSVVEVDGRRYSLDRNVSYELDKLYNMPSYGTLLTKAMEDLAEKRGISVDEIRPFPVSIYLFPEESPLFQENSLEFQSDTSPFSHKLFQVYVMVLYFDREFFTYHGSGDRVIQVSD